MIMASSLTIRADDWAGGIRLSESYVPSWTASTMPAPMAQCKMRRVDEWQKGPRALGILSQARR